MHKRGVLQKGFLFTVVLLLLATVVLSYTHQQSTGNVIRRGAVPQADLLTSSPQTPLLRAPPSCSTLQQEQYRYAIPATPPSQLPLPLFISLTASNLPQTLKRYQLLGSTVVPTFQFNPSNFQYLFGKNDPPGGAAVSFYLHATESNQPQQHYLASILSFTPFLTLQLQSGGGNFFTIPALVDQPFHLLGRPGRITSAKFDSSTNILQLTALVAGKDVFTTSTWEMNFSLSTSGLGIEGLYIDGEAIEDVYLVARGSRQGATLSLQDLTFYYLADGSDGFQHVDLPAGDASWQSLVDEPQPLVSFDWTLEFTPLSAVSACLGPGASILFTSDYC